MAATSNRFPKKIRLLTLAVCLVLGLALVTTGNRTGLRLLALEWRALIQAVLDIPPADHTDWGVAATPDPARRVPCRQLLGERTMVALILGQSNAANSVNVRYTPTREVFAYFDHACYQAADPLPGASAPGGSLWSRLGDLLVKRGLYDKVLFVAIARKGASLFDWARGGPLSPLLQDTLKALAADGIRVTHVFFHQGEADCGRDVGRWTYGFLLDSVIDQTRRGVGPEVPFFVSQASNNKREGCDDLADPACYKVCPAILAAQAEAVDPQQAVLAGPNTDVLVPIGERPDGSHFSARAADILAEAWAERLAALSRPGPPLCVAAPCDQPRQSPETRRVP